MSDSVYTFTEVVGTSTESWEKAATIAVERAARTLRDLRVAEVVKLDLDLEDGRVRAYRARVQISFRSILASALPKKYGSSCGAVNRAKPEASLRALGEPVTPGLQSRAAA